MGTGTSGRILIRVLDEDEQEVSVVPISGDGDFVVGRDAKGADIVLPDGSISRRHCLIRRTGTLLEVRDLESKNGIRIGRVPAKDGWNVWVTGRRLNLGMFSLEVVDDGTTSVQEADAPPVKVFPEDVFATADVSVADLTVSGRRIDEIDLLSIGGGPASFALVDLLRVRGLAVDRVAVLTLAAHPLERLIGIAHALGLRDGDRLRAPSYATLDNIWGTPGYALREAWANLKELKSHEVLPPLIDSFVGSTLMDPYGPRLGDLSAGVEREAARIGWAQMRVAGRALALRKTDDGRYAVAYRVGADVAEGDARNRFLVARHVHVATGWPAVEYSPLMTKFRRQHRATQKAAAAREPHEAIFTALASRGGILAVIGSGFDAFVTLVRALRIRQRQRQLVIVHVGPEFEFRDDDWPEAAHRLPPVHGPLPGGGPSAPEREDVLALMEAGAADGWYRHLKGRVVDLGLSGDTVTVTVDQSGGERAPLSFAADHVIDCEEPTPNGLDQPFLKDLIETYSLPTSEPSAHRAAGLVLTERFAVAALENGGGRVHVSGLPGACEAFPAMDGFLGSRIAAEVIADDLAPSLGLPAFGMVRSATQWLRWTMGRAP
jgi:pSer/pThr/pTyr-binding forkhead associated (FHA) protein